MNNQVLIYLNSAALIINGLFALSISTNGCLVIDPGNIIIGVLLVANIIALREK
jgi:hypothetical protein